MSQLPDPTLSPCVRICTLDDADVCMGCGRTLGEITGWTRMSHEERLTVMNRLAREHDQATPRAANGPEVAG